MTTISIEVNDSEWKILEKRAKENLMSVGELVGDIVRRSMLSYKGVKHIEDAKTDDPLVNVFSRKQTKKKKNKPKVNLYEPQFSKK